MVLEGYLIVSALLFAIGAFGFMVRRNAILMLISIELMFNAVNLSLVAFNAFLPPENNAGFPTTKLFRKYVVTGLATMPRPALTVVSSPSPP